MEINCTGVVIREAQSGENDKNITLLTAEYGKLYVHARGVKKLSSKNAPGCQLFAFGDFELVSKSGRTALKTVSVKELFYGLRSDIAKYSLSCYFCDLVCHIATENNDEKNILRLLLNALYAVANKDDLPLWQIKGAFELKLLCLCGYMPDFNGCACCGHQTNVGSSCLFSFEDGTITCHDCNEKSSGRSVPFSCTISYETIMALNYITGAPIEKFLSFKISGNQMGEFLFVCENFLLHRVERSFETLKIYKSIAGTLNNITEKNEKQK